MEMNRDRKKKKGNLGARFLEALKRVAAGAHLPYLGFLNLRDVQMRDPTSARILQSPPLVQAQDTRF